MTNEVVTKEIPPTTPIPWKIKLKLKILGSGLVQWRRSSWDVGLSSSTR